MSRTYKDRSRVVYSHLSLPMPNPTIKLSAGNDPAIRVYETRGLPSNLTKQRYVNLRSFYRYAECTRSRAGLWSLGYLPAVRLTYHSGQ